MEAAVMVDASGEFSSVMIPTPGACLLLPNICVAEIVPWRRIKVLPDTPTWCMGFLSWRGRMLSVVNFNSLNDVEIPKEVSARCLVVMNRARTREGPAFYALASNGLPRMLQLLEDDLSNADEGLGVADVMKVEVGTEIATIPNLAYVEQEVALLKADTAEL